MKWVCTVLDMLSYWVINMVKVKKYNQEDKSNWDEFIKLSKNGHFMFFRDYMEYHSDRFKDNSLILMDEKNHICGVFPANIKENALYSHQGLTFGGLVLSVKVTTALVNDIFESLVSYCKIEKIKKIIYKPIPYIYSSLPSQEDLYVLFIQKASIIRRDVSSSIDLQMPLRYSKGRKWSVNKAKKGCIQVNESTDYSNFWPLLSQVLISHHDAVPVHSLAEIEFLHKHFPSNIRLFTAEHHGEIIAGAVIYETNLVAHAQYLANSDLGRALGGLDFVLDHLIRNVYKDKKYFDFGISTENSGLSLNLGLIAQKEGFGASAVVHDFYELDIK